MPEDTVSLEIKNSVAEINCERFADGKWNSGTVYVPTEMELTLYVNGKELVSILCTPDKLNFLVLGFLYGEGIISGAGDIVMMRVCEDDSLADVRLRDTEYELPTVKTLTSGCGAGAVFKTHGEKVDSDIVITPAEVHSLMKQLQEKMELYRISGGVHTSALADSRDVLIIAEDIGRHNTLDKIQGECLMRGITTRDKLILSTGRVSSEMLLKAAKMQVPLVVSRHSPTERAVSMADDLGITLAGHARGGRLLVYTHPERFDRYGV